uniref:Uncharacterized protein n=1 Tax=Anguilla anguilla TaxID=7936 RepID=A0A0E9QLV7_ANGAN
MCFNFYSNLYQTHTADFISNTDPQTEFLSHDHRRDDAISHTLRSQFRPT